MPLDKEIELVRGYEKTLMCFIYLNKRMGTARNLGGHTLTWMPSVNRRFDLHGCFCEQCTELRVNAKSDSIDEFLDMMIKFFSMKT